MTTRIFSIPNLSKTMLIAATQTAGFIRVVADAIYEVSFRRVLRSIVRTI